MCVVQKQSVRDKVAEDTASVKALAKQRYLALEVAQKKQADARNLKRHLKEQLEILTDEDEEKKEVALKAEKIAKRMEEMAAKADGAWQEVKQAKEKTAAGYAEAQATAKATADTEAAAQKQSEEAEDKAQAALSKLAVADKEVRELLQVPDCFLLFVCACACALCVLVPAPFRSHFTLASPSRVSVPTPPGAAMRVGPATVASQFLGAGPYPVGW